MQSTKMQDDSANVSRVLHEIRKIVTTPYPVCLKGLHNYLRQCPDDDWLIIGDWLKRHGAQTRSLAASIVEGLSLWPYTLDVLRLLSHLAPFREALLQSHQQLLAQLLERSLTRSIDSTQLSDLLVQLLSNPLPSNVPLPASAQDFLWRLFERAVQSPDVSSLEAVYLVLYGAGAELLEILPQAGLNKLRDQATKMMRNFRSFEEQILTLYCLAIIAKVNAHHDAMHSRGEIDRFFTGERGLKTMPVLVLQVIYACRQDATGTGRQEPQRVRLARQVLQVVDKSTRAKWVQSNAGTMRKLYEKVAQPTLSGEMRLEALTFTGLLSEDSADLPPQFVDPFQKAMLDTVGSVGRRQWSEAVEIAFPIIVTDVEESFWSSCLRSLFDYHVGADGGRCRLILLRHVRNACLDKPTIAAKLIGILRRDDFTKLVDAFLADGNKGGQVTIRRAFCAFLLELNLADLNNAYPTNALQLHRIVKQLEHTSTDQVALPSDHKPIAHSFEPLSIIEATATPEDAGASRQWRERLADELGVDAKQRQDSVIQLVSKVCQDLEDRCNNVEAPLRAEHEKVEALQARQIELQLSYSALEDRWLARGTELEEAQRLIAEKDALLQDAAAETNLLNSRLDELEQGLNDANANAKDLLEQTVTKYEQQVLGVRSSVALLTEDNDRYEREMHDIRQIVKQKDQALEREKQQHHDALSNLASINNDLLEQLRTKDEDRERQEQVLAESRRLTEVLKAESKDFEDQVRLRNAEVEELQRVHKIEKHAIQKELEQLKTEQQAKLEAHQTRAAKIQQDLAARLEASNTNLKRARDQHEDHIGVQAQQIEDLQAAISEKSKELREKVVQLAQAEEWKSRLFAVMNPGSATPAMTRMFDQSSAKAGAERHRRAQSAHFSGSMADENAQARPRPSSADISSTLSARSPSPERAEPRRLLRTPATKHATIAPMGRTSKRVSSRRSLGLPALGETTDTRLNKLLKDRRRSEMPSIRDDDKELTDKPESDDVVDENGSDHVTPFSKASAQSWQRNAIATRMTPQNRQHSYFDEEDFEGTTELT